MTEKNTNFHKKVIGHELECFAYNSKTKQQSLDWIDSNSPKLKLQFYKSRTNTMLIISFSSEWITHKKCIKEGLTSSIIKKSWNEL